jgi:methionyl-tRNA synthetase
VTKTGKMSKSLGNVVDPYQYINEFGSDALRYFLMKEISIDSDGIFDRSLFIECFNADLANNYGNLVSRLIGMLKKYSDGVIKKGKGTLNPSTLDLIEQMQQLLKDVESTVSSCYINELINNIIGFTKVVNKYIEDTKP